MKKLRRVRLVVLLLVLGSASYVVSQQFYTAITEFNSLSASPLYSWSPNRFSNYSSLNTGSGAFGIYNNPGNAGLSVGSSNSHPGWWNGFTAGAGNYVNCNTGFALGAYNQVLYNWGGVVDTINTAIGHGLIVPAPLTAYHTGCVIVGRYNKPSGYLAGEAVMFGVGRGDPSTGTAPNNVPLNALTVYKSGKVVIDVPQGDISMGNYQ